MCVIYDHIYDSVPWDRASFKHLHGLQDQSREHLSVVDWML